MPGYIHHIQWSVKNVQETVIKLRSEYGFKIFAKRKINNSSEVAMKSGDVVFLISEISSNIVRGYSDQYPLLSSGRPEIESVFNICLAVCDVQEIYDSMISHGSISHHSPTRIESKSDGQFDFAVVSSPCENVIHSLVNINKYSGVFLPGFTAYEDKLSPDISDLMTNIDHVTYVCNIGDTQRILSWYSNCCGMERFFIAQDEDPDTGKDMYKERHIVSFLVTFELDQLNGWTTDIAQPI